ncbi:MAG: hypothetical protein HZB53_13370 [Chloroflexi bacterium]|nr:hypothetical protein [Chloroflexota bacterium]
MWLFLLPLWLGFALGGLSTFTTRFSQRWGVAGGQRATLIVRAVSVPFWSSGYLLAVWDPSPDLYAVGMPSALAGWAALAAGSVLITWSVRTLRTRAMAPSTSDAVEAHGPYAWIRHPVYAGMMLELAGLFLVVPSWTVLVASLGGILWLLVMAWLEERDLLQRAPDYRGYMQRVSAFLPRRRGAG